MLYRLHHVIPPHILISHVHATQLLTLFLIWIYLYKPLGFHLNICWGVSDSPGLACSGPEAWIEVEPSTKDQAYLSE